MTWGAGYGLTGRENWNVHTHRNFSLLGYLEHAGIQTFLEAPHVSISSFNEPIRLLIPSTAAPLGASQYGIETAVWGFRQVSARQSRNLQIDVTCPTERNAPQSTFPPTNALCSNSTAIFGLFLLISNFGGARCPHLIPIFSVVLAWEDRCLRKLQPMASFLR